MKLINKAIIKVLFDEYYAKHKEINDIVFPFIDACTTKKELAEMHTELSKLCADEHLQIRDMPADVEYALIVKRQVLTK